jgi:elongation factor G
MPKYESKSIRNMAVVGHGGTGKTTLCESALYLSGKTDRQGRVDDGTSVMDYEPEEQKRHVSINSATNNLDWNKCRINIIDTPGDPNFAFDTKNCLRIADGVTVVVDAVGGVEFQTEKVWEYAEEFHLPRFVFINRMDRERADFFRTVESINALHKAKVTLLALPIGKEDSLTGVIDLVSMKAMFYDEQTNTMKPSDIPSEMAETARKYKEILTEDIAETDDDLMNSYLENGELTSDALDEGLKKAVLKGVIIAVYCGSAIKNIGIHAFLDAVAGYFPSPVDRGSIRGEKPGSGDEEIRLPEETSPFSAFVFKTIADPFAGRLTLFRVYSGTLSVDQGLYNASKKITERISNMFFLEGKNQKPAETLIPGDIAAVAKLKETTTGDTLCAEKSPIIYQKVAPQIPVISFAVEAKSRGDEDKLGTSINRLIDEDPTLSFNRNDQTNEMILSGMGQIHIEVAVEKMKRKFGLEVNLKTPKVPYRETIKGKTRVQGRYKKQSGGRGQFGDTWLEIEPLPRGTGFEFADKIFGGVVPQQYRPAVEKGIVEAMQEGVLAGYPVVDLRVSLVDGSFHPVDSSEMAFKIAGSIGFKKGVLDCQPVLLEPIVNIVIEVTDEYMGDVIGDLNSRRGRVMGMDSLGHNQIIKGQVPLAEILKYAPDLRSMTSGRGTFTYTHSHYEEVPSFVAEKIIAESKKSDS